MSVAPLWAISTSSSSQSLPSSYTNIVARPMMTPAGIENRSTRGMKPGRTGSWLGWNDSTKPGMPIVSASTTVRCRGSSG